MYCRQKIDLLNIKFSKVHSNFFYKSLLLTFSISNEIEFRTFLHWFLLLLWLFANGLLNLSWSLHVWNWSAHRWAQFFQYPFLCSNEIECILKNGHCMNSETFGEFNRKLNGNWTHSTNVSNKMLTKSAEKFKVYYLLIDDRIYRPIHGQLN